MASTTRGLKALVPGGMVKTRKATANADDIRLATKFWLDKLATHYREMVDILDPGEISFETNRIAASLLGWTMDQVNHGHHHNMTPKDMERGDAEAALYLAGFPGDFSSETLDTMHKSMRRALDGYVHRRLAELKGEPPPWEFAPSPMFPERIDAFIDEKETPAEGHRPYKKHTSRQTRATFELFLGLMDERPVREYTKQDAGELRLQLLKLPKSFGKSPRDTDPKRAIAEAEAHDRPIRAARLTAPKSDKAHKPLIQRAKMKTVKRHFSSLSQYWEHLKRSQAVYENIFLGWPFPGTRSKIVIRRAKLTPI